ncbi:toxin HipA [Xylanibacter ruminicola]|uniref:HipA domain protein n=2 Tax=Xylanibacter ruminicola TaxID=839 RepID=D5ET46_XYLR2|nr:HipA domain-containing protein [Xylanibacter ruminicola]ADE81316.1 HipA domain protein [Xylanibacter ruminicola 23]GJG33929.1 toxin HipA [Xylanibacter ruminicola]SEH66011.1 serine/threonine-protein kinase HipA [Xylanibacter ruminicola]
MKKITVFADFDFLATPQEIGTLGYERIRGKDHFVFEYSREWLKKHGGIMLSGDLMNVPSLQHPRGADSVFGFVKDSFPDRWGRLLLDRRERLKAQAESRPVRMLTNFDYLTGIEDFTRMGGIRYRDEDSDSYMNDSAKFLVPPIESLRALCDACHEIESAEERNELPEQRWIDQLIDPGTSLGGARPKANVIDADGKLYVAKFPSKKDLENTELIEHFSHRLAAAAGINVANTHTIKISKDRHLLLSERFDRTADGRRKHFASAMSLLGFDDGAGSSTGNGYLDIVDFILQGCVDVQQNLRELYRRVAFNVMFGNTDDHFRNHGFLLTPKGWTLSPAYDINPGTKLHQCLLIDQYTEQSDANTLLHASGSYMFEQQEASEIIDQVRTAIKDWRATATELQVPLKILEPYCNRWDNL